MRRLLSIIHCILIVSCLLAACGPVASATPTAPALTATQPATAVPTITSTPPTAPPPTTPAPTAVPPKVVSRSPQTTLTDRRAVQTLTFDRAMDTSSVAAAISVTPYVPFRLGWAGQTLSLTPLAPLDPGSTYRFILDTGAADRQGTRLARAYRWEVRLPDLLSTAGLSDTTRTTPLALRFNYALNRGSLNAAWSISPPISGVLAWADQNTRVTFLPDQPWTNATTYTVAFAGLLTDMHGDVLATPAPITFVTRPAILAHEPESRNAVDPALPLRVTFDRPMDQAAVEAAFSLSPTVKGTFEWAANSFTFHPVGSLFADNTRYQATVAVTARDAAGQPILQQPYTWSFETYQYSPSASFGQGAHAQVLDAGGRRAVQFVTDNISQQQISFDLYGLSLNQFLHQYATGFPGFYWEHRTPISTAGLRLAAHWQLPPNPPSFRDYQSIIETILPAEVGPGLYLLSINTGPVADQLLLVVSQQVVMAKRARGQWVAWVTDMQGQPAAEREVALVSAAGEVIAEGQTDAAGVFRASTAPDAQPQFVVAHTGDDYTVSGLGSGWFSPTPNGYDYSQPRPATSRYAAYVYTDRPIYRPGQTVFYKAILRQDDDAQLSAPPEQTAITVRLRDARDNVVQTVTLATNPFGTLNGQFQLAEGAMLGDYRVEVEVDGERHAQSFAVQDYAKPDYAVTLTPSSLNAVDGDSLHVSLEARYLYGQPVSQATLVVKQYRLETPYCYSGSCANQPYTWYRIDERDVKAVTDADGRLAFDLNADLSSLGSYSNRWGDQAGSTWAIEATVDDGSHQSVSSFTVVKVYSAAEILRLRLDNYFQTPGQPIHYVATVTDLNGQPVAGRALELELRQWDSSSGEYTLLAQHESLGSTDAAGRLADSLSIAHPGFYQLHLSGQDGRGHPFSTHTWLYSFDANQAWVERYTREDLAIGADRPAYAPGDHARLAVTSSFSGPALLTFERGTSHREQLVELTAPLTYVDVEIQADDAPNIFVTVNAWKEADTTLTPDTYLSLADRHLRTAQVELVVPITDKTLTVTLTPSQPIYAPRETATFSLRVTDSQGQPAAAEVSLALVDEAIFSLAADRSGPIFDAFYFERGNAVRTFDSMAPYRYLWLFEGGGGGGGGDGALAGAPRSDFPDTAGWLPVVHTDGNGEAVVSLPLPDSLTTWRLTARAVTADTQVGEAVTRIVTQKPIIVQPVLPRSLTAGDRVEISAIVHNDTEAALTLNVTLESDLLRLEQAAPQTISLAAHARGTVGWTATALNAGTATVTVRAESDAGGDAVRLSLPIRPLAVLDVAAEVGAFTDHYETSIHLPDDAMALSTVRVELSRSIAGSLLNGLDYLTGYPYGCVEQTMSRALPNAVVARAFKQLGMTGPTLGADLPAKINASVQRLYGFQHNDGGWGWWLDDDSDAYETAWVVFGLSVTQEAGYEVDPAVVKRGVDWLNAHLDDLDDRTEAFALYSLAMAGQGNLDATQKLAAQANRLDTFSQAALALALHQLGADSDGQRVLDILRSTAVAQDGYVFWPNGAEDGHYQQKTMASTTRSTALALDAFVRLSPADPLEPGIVRWLMAQRREQGWGSTNETSFAILALTDHLLALENSTTDSPYTLLLNGQTVATGVLGPGVPAASLTISAVQLARGANHLELVQTGGGQLYYLITRRFYLAQAVTPAAGTITVTRAYLTPGTHRLLTQLAPGDLVEVSLTANLPQDASYVLVEDSLPGGLEALNEGLNTTSHETQVENCYDDYECQDAAYRWRQLGYNNKEVHGDRVSFFITDLSAGKHTFTYLARVTQSGSFTAMPAQVSAMYDARLWGRSASAVMVIGN